MLIVMSAIPLDNGRWAIRELSTGRWVSYSLPSHDRAINLSNALADDPKLMNRDFWCDTVQEIEPMPEGSVNHVGHMSEGDSMTTVQREMLCAAWKIIEEFLDSVDECGQCHQDPPLVAEIEVVKQAVNSLVENGGER